MQTSGGFEFSQSHFRLESRQVESFCAGFREEAAPSAFGRDTISIQGMSQDGSMKNPQFLAVLEERIISALI